MLSKQQRQPPFAFAAARLSTHVRRLQQFSGFLLEATPLV
jgi:hypothetical protein